ncbi:MAG: hypothetical protein K6G89_04375 [Clostridia bacterium]|nr:hypothetical protein [Clostridia bacterium]
MNDDPQANGKKPRITSVAVDNGGTKAAALRYDGDFIPVAFVKTGTLRGNTTPAETVSKRVDGIISGLGFRQGDEIDTVSGTFPPVFAEKFSSAMHVRRSRYYLEVYPGLAAAELFGDALFAICGTGVSVFSFVDGKTTIFGGFGSLISDEGSGYWIARQAFNAAIHDYEGRGPHTVLTSVIAEKYGSIGDNFRDAVFSIYKRQVPSLVSEIASLTPLVVSAAKTDKVAESILRDAGRLIGEQLTALARKAEVPEGLPVGISGSVWKRNPVMFEAFKAVVNDFLPSSEIVVPAYEPLVGTVMLEMAEKNKANGITGLTDENRRILKEYYKEFTFDFQ